MIDLYPHRYIFVFVEVKHILECPVFVIIIRHLLSAAIAPGKVHYPQRLMNKVYSCVTRVHACKRRNGVYTSELYCE